MRSWLEEFSRTWLADRALAGELDQWVKARLAAHRSLPPIAQPDVAPASVSTLVTDILSFGTSQRWFWVLAGVVLLSELLFAADIGGVFQQGADRWPTLWPDIKPLVILRNALMHPAHQSAKAGSGDPHISRFIEWLEENGEDQLANRLQTSWALLASRPVADLALRKLDSAGRLLARLLRIQ